MLPSCASASRLLRQRLLSTTQPRSREMETFCVHVADGRVTFQIKDHHATRESVRQEAKNYLRRYEVFNALHYGYQVSFEFCDAEIIDRNPPLPGEPQVIKSYFWSARIILLEDAPPTPVLEHPCTPIREMVGPSSITEEIGSAQSLYLLRLYRTIGLVDLQSQKPLALLVALVLSLFVFVLATGEARAEGLPSPTAQQRAVVGAVDGVVVLNGRAIYPTPVYPEPVYLAPVETTSVETAKIGRPPAAQLVTPPIVPPPVSLARPAASAPEPTPRGYPGMIPDGEEVAGSEPEPILTSPNPHNPELVPTPTDWHDPGALPTVEPEPTSDGALPTPGPVPGSPVPGSPVPGSPVPGGPVLDLSSVEPEGSREVFKPLGAASEPTPVPF